jgi:arginase
MPNELRLICCPFHNGRPDVSMGSGASRLAADQPLRDGIATEGWTVSDARIDLIDGPEAEIARVMETIRRVRVSVGHAVADQAFPLVLAGNCNSCLGTTAGIEAERLGVIWFDAHADFDDPEENTSGSFDVMALAMLTGRGWRGLRETVPGLRPVPERRVILAGARDLEPYQRRRLEESEVAWIPGAVDGDAFEQAVDGLSSRTIRVYLHVDLDSLDRSEARANQYAAAGGPSLDRLQECVRVVCERFDVAAAAITAYDPIYDAEGRTLGAARRISREIARGVAAGVMTR